MKKNQKNGNLTGLRGFCRKCKLKIFILILYIRIYNGVWQKFDLPKK
jgi:hypothetical protein